MWKTRCAVRPAPRVCYLRSWAGTEGRRRMSGLISVALGSVLGAIARYFISGFVARRVGETFPWGTFIINVTGAFLIGMFGRLAENSASILASPDPWLFAVTGFLGCFTPAPPFCLQTIT